MPRRRVLTQAQIKSLLALPSEPPALVRHYTFSEQDLAAIRRRRRLHNQLGFAVQLCALRYPGRVLAPGELIPPAMLRYIGDQLDIPHHILASYASRVQTRYEQLEVLRREFGLSTFARSHHGEFAAWLLPIALATTSAFVVAQTLMDELRRRRIIAPGPTVIERLVASAMLQAERHVAHQLTIDLSAVQRNALDELLQPHPAAAVSRLSWVRQPPGIVGHRAFARLIEQRACLTAIGLHGTLAEGVHPERLRQLAREGNRLTAQHLRTLAVTRRRAILVATVLDLQTRLTDDAIGMFDRQIGKLFRRAAHQETETLRRDARALNDKVRLLARLGETLLTVRRTGDDPLQAVGSVIGWEALAKTVEEAKQLVRPDGPDYAAIAGRGQPVLRRVGPLFLSAFEFRSAPAARPIMRAIEALREVYRENRRGLPRTMPTSFLKGRWRPAVIRDKGIDRNTFEFATFVALRDRLRSGDIWIVGSRQYRAIEDQLISRPLFEAMRNAGPLPVAVPPDGNRWLDGRQNELERRLAEVNDKAMFGRLEDVELKGATLKISPLKAITPEAADNLADRLYDLLPRVRITELLAEVDRWTDLSQCFTHLHSGAPAPDRRVVLTAILADATNLGLTRMAEACHVATYRQLAWTASWHLREETYGPALARLVDAQHAQPLSHRFGDGTTSSSDGQHFPLGGPGQAVGDINPHKSREPALSFYTHISNRYAPFHTKVISATAGEAAHVLDGLLYHGADLDIAVHHTDGGGVSDHVFALCHLLGFRFAPRIPNLEDRRLYVFGAPATWPALEPFIAGRADGDLITSHWDEVLRLATSIRTGVVSASLMLQRLGAYPRQNSFALALREIGRLERTLFTLDWIESPALRRQTTGELNKGEAKNALARAVCFHRLGRLRDRTAESQAHRASGLQLVVAAIILWNTVYLGRAINALRRQGEWVDDDLLVHLAPLGWQHINLTGDYVWAADSPLMPDGFRPLRVPAMKTEKDVLDLSA